MLDITSAYTVWTRQICDNFLPNELFCNSMMGTDKLDNSHSSLNFQSNWEHIMSSILAFTEYINFDWKLIIGQKIITIVFWNRTIVFWFIGSEYVGECLSVLLKKLPLLVECYLTNLTCASFPLLAGHVLAQKELFIPNYKLSLIRMITMCLYFFNLTHFRG